MKRNRTMMAMGVAGAIVLGSLGVPQAAVAQTTTNGTAPIHTQLPRNNVQGGQIAAARPGTWIQRSQATHIQRQAAALQNYGGITISQPAPQSFKDVVLPQLVQIFLTSINAVAAAINAAITSAT